MKKDTYLKKMDSMRKIAMSKPVGNILDSKVGKAGVKVGNAVIKGVKAPLKVLKDKAGVQKSFRNKNSTEQKFRQNSKQLYNIIMLEEILKKESVNEQDIKILNANVDLLSTADKVRFGFEIAKEIEEAVSSPEEKPKKVVRAPRIKKLN